MTKKAKQVETVETPEDEDEKTERKVPEGFKVPENIADYDEKSNTGKYYKWFTDKSPNNRSHCRTCKERIKWGDKRLVLATPNPFHAGQITKKYFCVKCATDILATEIETLNQIRLDILLGGNKE